MCGCTIRLQRSRNGRRWSSRTWIDLAGSPPDLPPPHDNATKNSIHKHLGTILPSLSVREVLTDGRQWVTVEGNEACIISSDASSAAVRPGRFGEARLKVLMSITKPVYYYKIALTAAAPEKLTRNNPRLPSSYARNQFIHESRAPLLSPEPIWCLHYQMVSEGTLR